MDWGMKFLPFIYRETQSDFFGKKGVSWHFSCLVIQSMDRSKLDLFCFIHIMEDGTQGWFSIANIIVHLLSVLKREHPNLEELFLKSDNAACYHCSSLIGFIQNNNKNFPITITEYNFSEAQSGKDLCDSKTGCCRLHMFRYANEGHDILNCYHMKAALESHGGVKGTQACIVSVDQQMEPKVKTKIQGISSYNNFTFTDEGIILQKAYKVGKGKKMRHETLADQNLEVETLYKMKVKQPFTGTENPGSVSLNQHGPHEQPDDTVADPNPTTLNNNAESYFACPDPSCQKVFAKCYNLEKHLAVGNHTYQTNSCSSMDMALNLYASKCEMLMDSHNLLLQTVTSDNEMTDLNVDSERIGWALRSKRKATRFSLKVKEYVNKICEACDRTGKRPDCLLLSEEIKKASDENGERLFRKEEWLTGTQIKGLIASYLAKKSKEASNHNIAPPLAKKQIVDFEEVTEDEDETLAEIVSALETDNYNENMMVLVDNVYSAVNIQ